MFAEWINEWLVFMRLACYYSWAQESHQPWAQHSHSDKLVQNAKGKLGFLERSTARGSPPPTWRNVFYGSRSRLPWKFRKGGENGLMLISLSQHGFIRVNTLITHKSRNTRGDGDTAGWMRNCSVSSFLFCTAWGNGNGIPHPTPKWRHQMKRVSFKEEKHKFLEALVHWEFFYLLVGYFPYSLSHTNNESSLAF